MLALGIAEDQVASPRERRRKIEDVAGRFVRQGQGGDAQRLGDPDREVAHQADARFIGRMTRRGHPWAQLVIAGHGRFRAAPEGRQESDGKQETRGHTADDPDP